MADRVGQQLGNYRLLRLLGEGGFAEVYLGEQVYLKTLAAIKVLHTRLAKDDLDGFLSEARTIAALKHPHIVRVLDFGVEGGTPYLVMDFAPGGTLRERTPKGTQLSLSTTLPAVLQVADALQYAHDQRLIHRDVKPENMLLDERQQIMLSDFGIATIAQTSRYQQSQGVAGTAAYMAPEQLQGKPRPASDQYSLGIVIYEWLTGARPFQGSFAEIASQHLFVPPPPLSEKLPTISPAVELAVLRALVKDPRERFASVQDFASAFEQACRMAPPLRPSALITTVPEPAPSGPLQQTDQTNPSWQFTPTRLTPTRPEEPPTLRRPPSQFVPPPAPTVPAAAPPTLRTTPAKTQVQSSGPMMPAPTFSGIVYGPAAPPALLPAQPRAKPRWSKWLLLGVLVLVLVSGGLLGLRLAGKGSPTSVGATPTATTILTATATPRPALGTIKEFAVPTAQSSLQSITAGPDGNVWFIEYKGNQIGRITPGGSITEFALPNAGSYPRGITAGPDGNLWFTEELGNRIGRMTPEGKVTKEFALPTPNSYPGAITVGPDGNLWFTEDVSHRIGRIGRITLGGEITEFAVPTANSTPAAITTGPDRNLWFTEYDANQIGRITPGGKVTEFAVPTAQSSPGGITTGPDGTIWCTEDFSNQIGRITPGGKITEFGLPSFSKPIAITAGPDGNLWFTEYSGNQIGRMTPGGSLTEFAVPTPNCIPAWITAGPDGSLWFTENAGNQIGWISPGP